MGARGSDRRADGHEAVAFFVVVEHIVVQSNLGGEGQTLVDGHFTAKAEPQ